MRGAGGQVEYVKIMQDFDGKSKVSVIFTKICSVPEHYEVQVVNMPFLRL